MTVEAIVMMIIAMVVVWGGMIAAFINIRRHPEDDQDLPATAPQDL